MAITLWFGFRFQLHWFIFGLIISNENELVESNNNGFKKSSQINNNGFKDEYEIPGAYLNWVTVSIFND